MALMVFLLTRWLRRVTGTGEFVFKKAPKKQWWDEAATTQTDKPALKTLAFRRLPHTILGVERGASRQIIEEARTRLLTENSPELVAQMSDEIQEVARRKTEEIETAYAAIVKDQD
jgi:DnaJ-domain-containing protein 1